MDCYLEQHVHQPTRLNNILDLVFTSEIQISDDIQVLAPVDNSPLKLRPYGAIQMCLSSLLLLLICSIQHCNQPIKAKTHLWCNQADYNAMWEFVRDQISLINSKLESSSSLWNLLNGILQEAIEKVVPRKSTTLKSNKPLWLTGKVLRQIRKKNTNCGLQFNITFLIWCPDGIAIV